MMNVENVNVPTWRALVGLPASTSPCTPVGLCPDTRHILICTDLSPRSATGSISHFIVALWACRLCGLWACRLWGCKAVSCGLQAVGCGVQSCGLQAVGTALWAAGCGAAGCGLQALGCRLWAAGCGMWIAHSGV